MALQVPTKAGSAAFKLVLNLDWSKISTKIDEVKTELQTSLAEVLNITDKTRCADMCAVMCLNICVDM